MANVISASSVVRHAVARLLAKFFLVHLQTEILKPDEVLQEDFKDWPVREMNKTLIAKVRREFNVDEEEELPAHNLFKTWCDLNGKFIYEESGFVGYNHIYFPRLLNLRDDTEESLQILLSMMRTAFDRFDYENKGISVSFFLNSESTMRELMRGAVRAHLPEWAEAGEALVLAQSRAFQTDMYDYFEGVLKKTLDENVRLLHGVLPQQVASELKRNGFVQPVHFADAAVLFTDFEGFSQSATHLAPAEVIRRLDDYFSEFDRISAAHGLERIKTIGDSYMAVAGVPEPHGDPVRATCDAALEIREASRRISEKIGPEAWNIRIGIHAGPLVAGVIGKQKFSYDVWGATVNFASRMESSGEPGRINVSADIYARAKPHYRWEARGTQPVKRLGKAEMFFLLGKA